MPTAAAAAGDAAAQKPPYSFAVLIATAIQESPEQRLPVAEIYRAIAQRFPYYHLSQKGWKNSVRHNLSLHACFQRVPRGGAERRGGAWRLDPACQGMFPQGAHRRRRLLRRAQPPPAAPYRPPPPPPPPYPLPAVGQRAPHTCPPGGTAFALGGPLDGYGAPPPFLPPGGTGGSWNPADASCQHSPDVPLLVGPCWDGPHWEAAAAAAAHFF